MRRRYAVVWYVVLIFMVTIGVAACGNEEGGEKTADGKTKIRAYLGGGDISEKIEELVNDFNAQSTSTEVEIVPMPADTASMVTVMFNSGNTPAVMALEAGDLKRAREKLLDISDLPCVPYASSGTLDQAVYEGKTYGVPYRIEGMGLIYNRKVLDQVLGKDFNPDEIQTLDELKDSFEKIQAVGIAPVVLGAQNWSLSSHLMADVYSGQSADIEQQREFIEGLRSGEVDLESNPVFCDLMDTVDVLKEYNYFSDNPLFYANDGDTTKQAEILTSGKAAFWFQGNWGSTAIESLDPEGDYGMIPLPVGNGTEFPNGQITTLVPMFLCVNKDASSEQQAAGKELIQYITQTERGWDFVVNDAKGLPAYENASVEIHNKILQCILKYQEMGKTKTMYLGNTQDHYVDTGAAMQRYLDGQIGRAEVADAFKTYWRAK